ncbi:MAG: hypothetical protein II187_04630 [Treponema sp.]|nr:hypothetical protein [Treponema sp.]
MSNTHSSAAAKTIIALCFIIIAAFVLSLGMEAKRGKKAAETRITTITKELSRNLNVNELGSDAFVDAFLASIGNLSDIASFNLAKGSEDIISYPSRIVAEQPVASPFIHPASTNMNSRDGSPLVFSIAVYTLKPSSIFFKGRIAFLASLCLTLFCLFYLIYMHLESAPAKAKPEDTPVKNDDGNLAFNFPDDPISESKNAAAPESTPTAPVEAAEDASPFVMLPTDGTKDILDEDAEEAEEDYTEDEDIASDIDGLEFTLDGELKESHSAAQKSSAAPKPAEKNTASSIPAPQEAAESEPALDGEDDFLFLDDEQPIEPELDDAKDGSGAAAERVQDAPARKAAEETVLPVASAEKAVPETTKTADAQQELIEAEPEATKAAEVLPEPVAAAPEDTKAADIPQESAKAAPKDTKAADIPQESVEEAAPEGTEAAEVPYEPAEEALPDIDDDEELPFLDDDLPTEAELDDTQDAGEQAAAEAAPEAEEPTAQEQPALPEEQADDARYNDAEEDTNSQDADVSDAAPEVPAALAEEPSPAEQAAPETAANAAPQGLFSKRTGFSWEQYMLPRLDSELIRSASGGTDLALFTIRVENLDWSSGAGNEISNVILQTGKYQDMLFEYGSDGCTVILPDTDIDQSLQAADELYTAISTILENWQETLKIGIGISARSLRMISGERLANESSEALKHAFADNTSPIVAFKVNPEKYRNYLAAEAAKAEAEQQG